MKTYKIIIKDESRLHEFGFYRTEYMKEEHTYDYRGARGYSLLMRASKGYLQIVGASVPMIKVICDMYKEGVIDFEIYSRKPTSTFRLSPDEAELIKKYREEKK